MRRLTDAQARMLVDLASGNPPALTPQKMRTARRLEAIGLAFIEFGEVRLTLAGEREAAGWPRLVVYDPRTTGEK
jgi:hypothetical protein